MTTKGSPTNVKRMSSALSCWLKSTDEAVYPSIELDKKQSLVIGRRPETNVRDIRVAKRQIEVALDTKQQHVLIKQLGRNDSGLNGQPIRMGLSVTAVEGDIVDLSVVPFPGRKCYQYRICFECEPPHQSLTKSNTVTKRPNECSDLGGLTTRPTIKIPKMFLNKSSSSADQFRKDFHLSTKGEWEAIKGDDLFVFANHECVYEYKKCVGAFDLDGTLIKTKSGRVFPKDEHDWTFRTPVTVCKLQDFFHEHPDFKFVIFTNQNGIRNCADVAAFKRKVELITSQIGVPTTVFVATKKDEYRKPMTGGWEVFVSKYNEGKVPDLSMCFYCGDAAGRPKDHSQADRFFALNLNLEFKTPEQFFEGSKPATSAPPLFSPNNALSSTLKGGVPNEHIPFPHSQEMIIMVGMPASGKSSYVKSALLPKGYVHVNRDTLKSIPKCLQYAESAIREGKSVVIDNTNPTKKDREVFLKLATQRKLPARCFVMKVDHVQCLHNNKFRHLIGDSASAIPEVAFNSFKSNYEQPTTTEGFGEIDPVYFIPSFETSEREELYRKYLLEK